MCCFDEFYRPYSNLIIYTCQLFFFKKKLFAFVSFVCILKLGIWSRLNEIDEFSNAFFPDSLFEFLEINELAEPIEENNPVIEDDDLPF